MQTGRTAKQQCQPQTEIGKKEQLLIKMERERGREREWEWASERERESVCVCACVRMRAWVCVPACLCGCLVPITQFTNPCLKFTRLWTRASTMPVIMEKTGVRGRKNMAGLLFLKEKNQVGLIYAWPLLSSQRQRCVSVWKQQCKQRNRY